MGSLVGAAVGIGTALFGGNNNQGSSQTSAPNQTSQNYSTGLNKLATDVYGQQTALGPYTGGFYSPITAQQQQVAGNAYNWSTGGATPSLQANATNTLDNANSTSGVYNQTGLNIAQGSNAINPQAQELGAIANYGTGQTTTQGATPGLSSALNSAATTAAGQLGGYGSQLMQNAQNATKDQTARISGDADSYANNSTVDNAVNATNATIAQTLNEQTLPGLNRQAAQGGNLNSSRAGAAQAEAQGQAATAEGSADAAIRSNAYNTGLSTASGLYTSGLNASNAAAGTGYGDAAAAALGTSQQQTGLNEFNTTTQLGAANSVLGQNLAYNNSNTQNMLAANAQLGQSQQLGVYGSQVPGSLAAQQDAVGQSGANVAQADANAQLQGNYENWQQQYQTPANTYNQYANAIGQINQMQASPTQTQTAAYNPVSTALGGAAAGYGLYGNLVGNGNNSTQSGGLSGLYNGFMSNQQGTPGLNNQGVYNYSSGQYILPT